MASNEFSFAARGLDGGGSGFTSVGLFTLTLWSDQRQLSLNPPNHTPGWLYGLFLPMVAAGGMKRSGLQKCRELHF